MNNKLDVPKIIDSLVKLQSVAEEAYHLEIDSEKLDKAFQNEKELCEKLKVQCDDLNTKITELEDENKESQATIDGYLEDIQKIKDKEKMVKTQREYVALDTEQSLKREEIVVLEKAIGTKNKEIDTLKASLEQSKSDLEKQENLLSEKKDEVALRKVEIDDKMREIVRVREEVTPHLDQETLSRF
ncbi:MAG: hypothetical protein OEZ36_13195, partial [Spirochaetota bacterium]|nr:hypothetical protein [Spirochaetota bacterium]